MLALVANLALADTITLDSGGVIEGDLARYEMGGDCQVSVTEGPLVGVIVIVPCHRVLAFVRTSPPAAPVLAAVVGPADTVEESIVMEMPEFPEAEAELIDAGAGAGDPPAASPRSSTPDAGRGEPREAPSMPPVTTRSLSF